MIQAQKFKESKNINKPQTPRIQEEIDEHQKPFQFAQRLNVWA